ETASLAETGEFNAGSLYVVLSQPYAAPVTVRLDLSNMQAGETNVAFFATPLYVDIPAGATTSPEVFFNVPDGTVWSGGAGVMVTPVITNAAAAGVYTRTRAGRVYVQNAAPQIIQPLATDVIEVTRGEPHAFNWTVNDVLADRESGMTLSWSFGDGTSTNVSGAAGSVLKSYAINGPKVVKVTAADKDGGVSAEVQFTVNVVNPVPKPSVRVVPAKYEYAETNLVNTGRFNVYLSDPIGDDTYVRFDTYPAGQVNMLTSSGVKISAGTTQNVAELRFSLLDGTPSSELYGIEIMPVVTNAEAAAVFKDMQSATIYVNNQPPRITMPAGGVELGPIPAGVPYAFNYKVSDVAADLDTMLVHWTFSDGDPVVTVTGAVGSVSHTYIAQGTHRVIVQAEDKDGGLSPEVEFTIVVGPPPTVSVITPGNVLSESGDEGNDDEVVVRLSTTYPTAVTVNLTVTPANSTLNGILTLSSYSVTIPAGRTEWPVLISNVKDGTLLSNSPGFTVTPTIADPAVDAFYTIKEPGYIRIRNVAPYFVSHTGQTPPGATTPVVVDAVVGVAGTYSWHVWDDAAADRPTLSVTWIWADGNTDTATGASGSVTHTYTAAGTYSVMIEARDKDGGYANRIITVVVRAAKALNVTPIGPNTASYYGAGTYGRDSLAEGPNTGGGIGYGTIVWRTTQPNGFSIISDVYRYSYAASVTSAEVEAIPYRTDPVSGMYDVTSYDAAGVANPSAITDVPHDSFFLCWDGGTEEGLAAADLNPATASAAAEIALAAATDGGTAGAPATDPEIRRVRAIFSREWIATDYDSNQHPPTISLGDINKDGIPDGIAISLLGKIDGGGAAGGGEGATPAWLDRLDSFNNDLDKVGGTAVGDYYPVNPRGVGGTFDFRPTGAPFNCFKEIRGDHEGLNYYDGNRLVSVPFGPEDEPGTDPTMVDTDDDMLPDGWEYWFWRAARFGFNDEVDGDELTGEAYNPLDVAKGIFIPSRAIETGFNPSIHSGDTERDFDNDGLKDVEELLLGTNPTHWDTDGDGICDGWEFQRGMNPLDPSDAGLNLDGDYMAYALVDRKLLTVVVETAEESVTNLLLCVEDGGPYTACYRYGADSGHWAVGLPAEMPAGGTIIDNVATNALLLHFQVLHEFGFDPRTAWTDSVNAPPLYDRFPAWVADTPNTKAFTALDEYLLLKFMSELRLDGAADIMLPTALVWERYSTHPLTPDSDITKQGGDGMPDGWELYVAIAPGVDLSVEENRLFRISPWNHLDGALDHPVAGSRDGLVNRREFAGTDSSAAYTNPDYYNMTNRLGDFIGNVSITFHEPDIPWINKFWPTNPWSADTDGDGLNDLAERTFIYGTPGDSHTTCTQGGGLNPNAVDTDLDGLPDAWEREFAGTMPEGNGPFSGIVIADGMDGTVKDEQQDWDFDGLKNYQEYWVQAVRAFRYDIPGTNAAAGAITGNPGLPMDIAFQPNSLFTEVTNMWDLSRYPWGDSNPNLWIMLPVGGSPKRYVSTDPRDWDTDKDGMDDYYELFHGLNPILGNG
ncbi:MAG: PKD domain-containing protein, partial [Kiritimatiellae bacterium]|nr:PKD domain-containing protein [Kiritimatiellia bacterium]